MKIQNKAQEIIDGAIDSHICRERYMYKLYGNIRRHPYDQAAIDQKEYEREMYELKVGFRPDTENRLRPKERLNLPLPP